MNSRSGSSLAQSASIYATPYKGDSEHSHESGLSDVHEALIELYLAIKVRSSEEVSHCLLGFVAKALFLTYISLFIVGANKN